MRARLCLLVSFCLLAGIPVLAQIFVQPPQYAAADQPVAIAVGDFNGDGKPDLAVTNLCPVGGCTNGSASVVSILLGNGDGTFQTRVDYPAGDGPGSIAVGDFDVERQDDGSDDGCSYSTELRPWLVPDLRDGVSNLWGRVGGNGVHFRRKKKEETFWRGDRYRAVCRLEFADGLRRR